MFISN